MGARLLLALLLVVGASSAWAEPEAVPPAQVLASLLQVKNVELDRLAREADALQVQVDGAETTHGQILERILMRLQALEVTARLVRSNPYDMRAALAEAQFVQKNAEKERAPLEATSKEIALKRAAVAALVEDLERKWAAALDKDIRAEVLDIRARGTKQEQAFRSLGERVDKLLSQYAGIQERAGGLVARFQAELPQIWEVEFLEPKPFRLWPASPGDVGAELQEWLANVVLFVESQRASLAAEAQGMAAVFALFWLPFSVLGLVFYRHLTPLFPPRAPGQHLVTAASILCLTLGVSLLAAFFSGRVSQTSLLLVGTHALILGGAQALSWRLRRFVNKAQGWQPLLPLCLLFGGAILLDVARLPAWLHNGIWLALVASTSVILGLVRPQLAFEAWVRRLHPGVMFLLLVVAITGRARLAMLGAELWCVGAVAAQLCLGSLGLARHWLAQTPREGWAALLAELGVSLFALFAWTGMALAVLGWLAVQLGTNMVFERLSAMELNWGEFSFNFLRLGVVFLLFQVVRSLAAAWQRALEAGGAGMGWDRGAKASLARVGVYGVWILFAVVAMHLLGLSLTNLAVIAGGLSVGIGFGLQTLINNFVSGIILLFDRSLRPGDIIELDGLWVVVRSVNIRNTEVQTFDNATILIPNAELISRRLTNWTHKDDPRIRRDITVGVAYGSDIAQVRALLLEVAHEHPAVLPTPAPQVVFAAFGASSLDFILRVWLRHVDFAVSAPSELREAIDAAFREAGVEIAFPQLDIHLRPGDGVVRFVQD